MVSKQKKHGLATGPGVPPELSNIVARIEGDYKLVDPDHEYDLVEQKLEIVGFECRRKVVRFGTRITDGITHFLLFEVGGAYPIERQQALRWSARDLRSGRKLNVKLEEHDMYRTMGLVMLEAPVKRGENFHVEVESSVPLIEVDGFAFVGVSLKSYVKPVNRLSVRIEFDHRPDYLRGYSGTSNGLDFCPVQPLPISPSKGFEAAYAFSAVRPSEQVIFLGWQRTGTASRTSKQASTPLSPPVDVGIYIALKEEFRIFRAQFKRRYPTTWVGDDHPKKAFTYYRGLVPESLDSREVSLAVFCAEEMGPGRASNASSAFLDHCQPRSIVVIGIAGSMDKDLKLCDLFLPEEVNAFLENSAIDDVTKADVPTKKSFRPNASANINTNKASNPRGDESTKSWEFRLSGNHYRSNSHLLNQARQIETKFPSLDRAWKTRASARLARALKTIKRNAKEDVTRKYPRVTSANGHLASGPSVNRSEAFSKWLQTHDRKIFAIEMETAYVFEAAFTQKEEPRTLTIRGISDFADDRKSKVEHRYKGIFRKISMANAADFFAVLLEAGVFASEKG